MPGRRPGRPRQPDPAGPDHGSIDAFFAGHPQALGIFRKVRSLAEACGPCEVRVSRSQITLRRRRGFAYVWLPGRWLAHPSSEVVLSIALSRPEASARFKQVAHPAPRVWMHHLEVPSPEDLDDEVASWLEEAYTAAE